MISQTELDKAKAAFKKLSVVDSMEEKQQLVVASRCFIQQQFRNLQPSQAVEDLKLMWSAGPVLLSEWFEWLVSGSKDGSLAISAGLHMEKVFNIVEQYIISKKGSEFEQDIQGVKEMGEIHHATAFP